MKPLPQEPGIFFGRRSTRSQNASSSRSADWGDPTAPGPRGVGVRRLHRLLSVCFWFLTPYMGHIFESCWSFWVGRLCDGKKKLPSQRSPLQPTLGTRSGACAATPLHSSRSSSFFCVLVRSSGCFPRKRRFVETQASWEVRRSRGSERRVGGSQVRSVAS